MLPTNADFDQFLIDISDCFTSGDLPTWRARILLPFSIVTRDGPVVLINDADVAANFQHYLSAMETMRVDLIARRPISFEDCGDGTWLGTYETRLVSQNVLATPAYTSTALLTHSDGTLKMLSILNGRGHHEWTGIHPKPQT